MEKPLFEYRNRLRNGLIIVVWALLLFIGVGAIGLSFHLLELHPKWNPELDWIVFIAVPTITIAIPGWHIRLLRLKIFVDSIVFKEQGPHPTIEKEFGIVFDNIYDYNIDRIFLSLYRVKFKRRNEKTLRKFISFSDNELSEFSKILSEKVKIGDS